MFRKIFHIIPFLVLSVCGFSQARLVLTNDAFINISNAAFLVIDNGNANAITQTGTGGRIITEAETNVVRWNISNNTGTYTIPYYDNDNAQEIPFSVNISVAGSAGGRIDFSTYDNASWNNATYMPTDVTNMNSFVGGPNNSPMVIDRFWIADASSFGTKPTAALTFTYIDAEWSAAGNTITEGNLGAQRFNTPAGNWDTYLPQGTWANAGVLGTVSNAPAIPTHFFRSWTLVDNTSPLPIELISNSAECSNNEMVISWSTATETNNSFFTIQRSTNGSSFHDIGTVPGANNSITVLNYSFVDENPLSGINYYRLKQTDNNGSSEIFSSFQARSCEDGTELITTYSDQQGNIVINIDSFLPGNYEAELFDALGKKILAELISVQKGSNRFYLNVSSINSGIYFISIRNEHRNKVTKVLIN